MEQLIKTILRTPNKGKTHIFLGSPLSDACDKTTVEPGNSYSPGVWTCGISIWVEEGGKLFSPDLLEDEKIYWGFEGDRKCPPVLETKYKSGNINVEGRICHLGESGAHGIDFNEIRLCSEAGGSGSLYIAVKDVGPAGGKIASLEWEKGVNTLLINEGLKLVLEKKPDDYIILVDESKEISLALIKYDFCFKDNAEFILSFKTVHAFSTEPFTMEIKTESMYKELTVEEGITKSKEEWDKSFAAKIFSPDIRLEQLWERQIFHILSAMECGLPRIGAVNYPVFWLRDGVIILRVLDLIGRHDLARIGNDYLTSLYFGGGFGAESDAPGEALWALISHWKITKDIEWLRKIFPHIERRVEYIEAMLSAKSPIRIPCESRMPRYMNTPGINVLCLPSKNGLIHGRMDWHSPDFFINVWAQCGLRLAAETANELGYPHLCKKWTEEGESHEKAIMEYLIDSYGENDRDTIITPYPSGTLTKEMDKLRERFKEWYLKNRINSDRSRVAEPLWTYFEAAQIHNALLLGLKELAWINLNGMLSFSDNCQVSAYIEGTPGGNEYLPFRNDVGRRGWLNRETATGGNMPHNWTAAEMITLIRDIFVVEEEGYLVLGKGVPKEWLKPGCSFGVKDMPTDFGTISYTVKIDSSGNANLEYHGPNNYKIAYMN
jgi:hypothetical protein